MMTLINFVIASGPSILNYNKNIGNFHVGDSYIVLKVCVFIMNNTIVLSSIITENLTWKCETILNLTSTIKNFNVHIKSTFYRPKCIFFNTGNVLVHHW